MSNLNIGEKNPKSDHPALKNLGLWRNPKSLTRPAQISKKFAAGGDKTWAGK